MAEEFVIDGVILSPIVPQLIAALLLTFSLSLVLMRLHFYKLVWHRPLFELALFCVLLAFVVGLSAELRAASPSADTGEIR